MNSKTPETGRIAVSTQGRDCGRYYVVVSAEGRYVYLADGSTRKLSSPKKKNIKHIRLLDAVCADIGIKSPFDGSFNASATYGLKKLTHQVQSKE